MAVEEGAVEEGTAEGVSGAGTTVGTAVAGRLGEGMSGERVLEPAAAPEPSAALPLGITKARATTIPTSAAASTPTRTLAPARDGATGPVLERPSDVRAGLDPKPGTMGAPLFVSGAGGAAPRAETVGADVNV